MINFIVIFIVLLLALSSSWIMAAVAIIGMVLLFLINLISRQESMLYVPCVMPGMQTPGDNPEGLRSPADKGLTFEDVQLETTDGVELHAWFISAFGAGDGDDAAKAKAKKEVANAPTILFCHANAGNIGLRVPNFASIVEQLHANVLALDYRGYGYSQGEPGEDGLIEDALTGWRWLQSAAKAGRINGDKLFIFGRSLGGAVAIALASELQKRHSDSSAKTTTTTTTLPRGVMLENTFTSIGELVDVLFPVIAFKTLKDRFLRLRWDSFARIAKCEVPFLFLSGAQDELVPPTQMQALHAQASLSRHSVHVSFAEGKHNDTWERGGDEYWDCQSRFLRECLELEPLHAVAGEVRAKEDTMAAPEDDTNENEGANSAARRRAVPVEPVDAT